MNRPTNLLTALAVVIMLTVPAVMAVASPGSDGDGEFPSYYDQLDINGKAIYDAVESAGVDTLSLTIDLPVALTASSEEKGVASELVVNLADSMVNDVFKALRLSSPLAYWGWGASAVTYIKHEPDWESFTYTISSVTLSVSLDKYPPDPETGHEGTVRKMIDDLRKAIDGFSTKSTGTRDKIMDINNYIVDLVTYDPNAGKEGESLYSHDAYGALAAPDHHAVCDGYSKAFLLLCEKENIDCVIVLGTAVPRMENHAWNYVKMDNGSWYAIDVTWNDGSNNAYFLQGGANFFSEHQQGVYLGQGYTSYPFRNPPISISNYDSGGSGYEQYAWVLAIAIVAMISIVLIYARGRI
ncbi:MAG: hypothetical protein LBU30_01895 [Candidatus Methanoplasma sp.]|jgi:hypothetical protein|nr:hypothetical protein [Candidatus Methanoplasma sp.]